MPDAPINFPWAFGSPKQRKDEGGIMVRAWMDSIYPYTKPDPEPSWWTPNPLEPGYPGSFPGFERNMRESGGSAPNFPANRHFNTVILNTYGLFQSSTAPYRQNHDSDDNDWPQNRPGDAVSFITLMEYYVENYLAEPSEDADGPYVILVLPERELINMYAQPGDFPGPDPVDTIGTFAILEIVNRALELLGDRLIGWFLVDEPDVNHFGRQIFATPANMLDLRNLIHVQEKAFADANPETATLWHRPCIINFAEVWYLDSSVLQPEDFVSAGAVDMLWMDRFPWRLTTAEVPAAYGSEALAMAGNFGSDPIHTAVVFRELIKRIKDAQTGIANANPVSVMSWQQSHGNPYRELAVMSSDVEPQTPPSWLTWNGKFNFPRCYRQPTLAEARFEAWLAIFGGSEGLAYFAQPKVSDNRITDYYRLIAQELKYFNDLRVQAPGYETGNLTKSLIEKQSYAFPAEVTDGELAYMTPLVRIYRFLQPPRPPEDPPVDVEHWMFLLNRSSGTLNLRLQMQHGVWQWGLQEYQFTEPIGNLIKLGEFIQPGPHGERVPGTPAQVDFTLERWTFKLYKAEKPPE